MPETSRYQSFASHRPTHLAHLFYLTALSAVCWATFGMIGVPVGCYVILVWLYIYTHRYRWLALWHTVIATTILLGFRLLAARDLYFEATGEWWVRLSMFVLVALVPAIWLRVGDERKAEAS